MILFRMYQKFIDRPGDFVALKNNNIHIRKGQFLAIMGPSGSGKAPCYSCWEGLTYRLLARF